MIIILPRIGVRTPTLRDIKYKILVEGFIVLPNMQLVSILCQEKQGRGISNIICIHTILLFWPRFRFRPSTLGTWTLQFWQRVYLIPNMQSVYIHYQQHWTKQFFIIKFINTIWLYGPLFKIGKIYNLGRGVYGLLNYELSFTYRCVGEYYIENVMYMHLT